MEIYSEISGDNFLILLEQIDQNQLQGSAILTSKVVVSMIKNKKGNAIALWMHRVYEQNIHKRIWYMVNLIIKEWYKERKPMDISGH